MPQWIQRSAGVGLVLLFLGAAGGAVAWTWGPRFSFERSCHLCGRTQQCGERIGLHWEGKIQSTVESDWIGDRVKDHEHIWLARGSHFGELWWGADFFVSVCDEARTVVGAIYWRGGTEPGDAHSRLLLEEFVADLQSRDTAALADWCERFQTRVDPWTEPAMGF